MMEWKEEEEEEEKPNTWVDLNRRPPIFKLAGFKHILGGQALDSVLPKGKKTVKSQASSGI